LLFRGGVRCRRDRRPPPFRTVLLGEVWTTFVSSLTLSIGRWLCVSSLAPLERQNHRRAQTHSNTLRWSPVFRVRAALRSATILLLQRYLDLFYYCVAGTKECDAMRCCHEMIGSHLHLVVSSLIYCDENGEGSTITGFYLRLLLLTRSTVALICS
jgi:hypothetical protein